MIKALLIIFRRETDRRIEKNSNNPFPYNLYDTVNKYGQMQINKKINKYEN